MTDFLMGRRRMGSLLARRSFVALLSAGATAFAASWLWTASDGGEGFDTIARWSLPGGEGRMIAVNPGMTDTELRDLGRRPQDEFSGSDSAVVMVFDSAEAGRQVRRGSRIVGERDFRKPLHINERCISKTRPEKSTL